MLYCSRMLRACISTPHRRLEADIVLRLVPSYWRPIFSGSHIGWQFVPCSLRGSNLAKGRGFLEELTNFPKRQARLLVDYVSHVKVKPRTRGPHSTCRYPITRATLLLGSRTMVHLVRRFPLFSLHHRLFSQTTQARRWITYTCTLPLTLSHARLTLTAATQKSTWSIRSWRP